MQQLLYDSVLVNILEDVRGIQQDACGAGHCDSEEEQQ